MELSHYVEALRHELSTLTRFATEEIQRAAGLLADALDAPVRLVLLQALSDASAEITARFEDAVVEVRLTGGEPEFVVTPVHQHTEDAHTRRAPTDPDGADEAGTARVTLRLPESLKVRVEAEAAAAGISVNSWLVRAAAWAADAGGQPGGGPGRSGVPRGRGTVGQRITGYARG